jgi:hypothetical protein
MSARLCGLVAAAITAACSMPLWRVPDPVLPDALAPIARNAEYGVYSFLIDNAVPAKQRVDTAFVASVTVRWLDQSERRPPAGFEGALRAFYARNQVPDTLGNGFVVTRPLVLLPPGQVLDRQPTLAFSLVGFNADSTRAVVAETITCGLGCASGRLLYLARKPGRAWTVWRQGGMWIT